jgi:hypothetical protein
MDLYISLLIVAQVILKDLGRNWMKEKSYNRGLTNFTSWEIRNTTKGKTRAC